MCHNGRVDKMLHNGVVDVLIISLYIRLYAYAYAFLCICSDLKQML